MSPARKLIALAGLCIALFVPATAQANFGFVPGSVSATTLNSNGTIDEQAGSHTAEFQVHFELKTDSSGELEGGQARDVIVNPPAGLVGNPGAVPSCPRQQFEGSGPHCPASTQIGTISASVVGIGRVIGPMYNITAPPGSPTMFGFSLLGRNVFFDTRDKLALKDKDELLDIYDAREGGGIAVESEISRAECQGENCQAPVSPPNDPTPASSTFEGSGNVKETPAAKKHAKKKHKHAKKHKKAKKHARTAKRNHGGAK